MVVTQDFLTEFEVSLLRSYNRASRKSSPSNLGQNVVLAANSRENFLKEFMIAFQDQKENLEQEIARGGHHNASQIFDVIAREVETKIRLSLFQNKLDPALFQKIVRDLRVNVRSAFYIGYLSK